MRSSGFDRDSIEVLNRRLTFVTLFVIVAFSVLILRLWYLQVVRGLSYRVQSENNRISLHDIPPFRGMIFDRNGELLVDNRPSYDLYIIPEEIQDRHHLFESLKMLIGFDPETILSKSKTRYRMYPFKPILVKKSMSRNELAVIETNRFNLPGVMVQVKPQRHYINGTLASHLIGYLGEISKEQLNSGKYPDNKSGDLIGKVGVEGKWQKSLNGFRGGEQVEVDAAGRRLKEISRKPPISGQNIHLTIDKNLQMVAEKCLEGKKGAIVAIEPNTGEVIALTSSPAFDPNLFVGRIDPGVWNSIVSSKDFPLQNRAITGQYSPGSTFKIVMALAAFEEGIIDPQEEIFCNRLYFLGRSRFQCWKKGGHGKVDFFKALTQSCDVYFYKLGRKLGIETIAHYAHLFGLGKKTGYDLGSETTGLVPTDEWKRKKKGVGWQKGETISVSVGQGFLNATPLQMVRVIAAVFNGGYLYQPKVVKLVGSKGSIVYKFSPTLLGQLGASEENLELIKNALIGVVHDKRGTGRRARIKGVLVAGKTGTTQVVGLKKEKAYKEGEVPEKYKSHAWFVSIAPADDPKLALAILVEHGEHGSWNAPIAKKLFEAYLPQIVQ